MQRLYKTFRIIGDIGWILLLCMLTCAIAIQVLFDVYIKEPGLEWLDKKIDPRIL